MSSPHILISTVPAMPAFIPSALPIHPHRLPAHRTRRPPRRTPHASSDQPSSVSLDTLSTFKSFCWRTQATLCHETAQADGLGTFEQTPHVFPEPPTPQTRHTRVMQGGRAFKSAMINVWASDDSRPPARSRLRRRVLTSLDMATARVEYVKEAAGVTIKLLPHDPCLPGLRADMHYFQIGGGCLSWWFSGTADLCIGPSAAPNVFMADLERFLNGWQQLCARHRAGGSRYARECFLEGCYGAESDDGVVADFDRVTSFAFVTEAVDALLPAYLSLLSSGIDRSFLSDVGIETGLGADGLQMGDGFGNEVTDSFCLSGGAACESTTVRGSPLGSWRFSLAPSALSAAGKAYDALRNDHGAAWKPILYI